MRTRTGRHPTSTDRSTFVVPRAPCTVEKYRQPIGPGAQRNGSVAASSMSREKPLGKNNLQTRTRGRNGRSSHVQIRKFQVREALQCLRDEGDAVRERLLVGTG